MFAELHEKGLGLVAINGRDEADVINKYAAESKFTFQIGMADRKQGGKLYDIGEKYGISAYPTNYLVDASTGKVVWRGVGFNEDAIRSALAKLNIK